MPRYIVRYGVMRALGVLSTRGSDRFARNERVVARTPRGLEVGDVLCEATEGTVERLKNPGQGQILRRLSSDDTNEWAHIQQQEANEFKACQRHVEKLDLPMQLVDMEHLFGGERIVVYYLSEQRVDFRELVKELASEFQTRIEMRQIGVRDEAKLLADYGDCGKPVCCSTHLTEMPPVSMKMAKLQKATLDPTKISGRCGRLKCCLRYEYDTYEELHKQLPPIGAEIVTENGRARVINQEILTQQLLIQSEDNRRVMIDASEVMSVIRKSRREREEAGSSDAADSDGDGRGSRSRDRSRSRRPRRGRDDRSRSSENREEKKEEREEERKEEVAEPSSEASNTTQNAGGGEVTPPPTPDVGSSDASGPDADTGGPDAAGPDGGGNDQQQTQKPRERRGDGRRRRRRGRDRKPSSDKNRTEKREDDNRDGGKRKGNDSDEGSRKESD